MRSGFSANQRFERYTERYSTFAILVYLIHFISSIFLSFCHYFLVLCNYHLLQGTLNGKGKRKDVDKEFALLFTVLDENESWYLKDNIKKYTTNPSSVNTDDDDFKESNKMHAINGFLFANGPDNGDYLRMKVGEKVSWYLIGFGNEVDIHTVHFHANDFIHVSVWYQVSFSSDQDTDCEHVFVKYSQN